MEELLLYDIDHPKIRIGKENDGGYVIAQLPNTYDLFLSGGISTDVSFEEDFLTKYPKTPCFAYDGTIQELPMTGFAIRWVAQNVGNGDSGTTNMTEQVNGYENIFMKLDIEGHEFRMMPSITWLSKVKQFVVEIHSPADIAAFPEYYVGLQDVNSAEMFKMFHRFNETHTLIHFHANNGCGMELVEGVALPRVFELTYVRNDHALNKRRNAKPLPTELDMPNVPTKPDYSLNGFPYQ